MTRWMFAALFAVLSPLTVLADEAGNGRFTLEKTQDGVIRLDTRTGEMSLCREQDGSLICRMAADERAAYEQELDRLADRMTALEGGSGSGKASGLRPDPKATAGAGPSDAEIDQGFAVMEKMMRRFMGLAEELNKETH